MNLLYVILAVLAVALLVALAVHFHVTLADIRNKVVSLFHLHAAVAIASASATVGPSPVVPPADHGATPPANAGATGVSVGKSPVGMSAPDSDGCAQIPAIAAKLPPGTRFMTVATLPYVPAGSAQSFAIAANCANARMTLHLHGGNFVGGPENFYCLPPVANPASAVAIGGAAFHLLGQVYGEPVGKNLPNAYAITSDLTTVDEIVAFYGKFPDYAPPNYAGSPVAGGGAAGPGHGAESGK